MQHKLKYIELFEELSLDDIPYSKFDNYGKLNITFPESATSVPPVLNELTTEVTGWIKIIDTSLHTVTGFESLKSVGNSLWIEGNPVLQNVTGFDQLQTVGDSLWVEHNPVLETVTGFNQLQTVGGGLWIYNNTSLHTITEFNQLQTVGYSLSIQGNPVLETVTGFNQLQSVGSRLSIIDNTSLHTVTGFEQLQSIGWNLCIQNNPNLVALSIPSTLIRSVNYKDYHIEFEDEFEDEHEFESPEEFVNSDVAIKDCIDKFDPGLHSDTVVTQILENIETWGTPATQGVIINHLLSKRNYWSLIPEKLKHLIEDTYKHLYHSDFKNTGAKSVAKVATGVTYGLF